MLPRKKKRERMGVKPEPRRIFQTHRAYVRRHQCTIPNCPFHSDPIEFAHIGPVGSSGMAMKAPDWYGTSWCRSHHRRAHDAGHETMCAENGTTMEAQRKIAAELARTSPDKAMREAMREAAEITPA